MLKIEIDFLNGSDYLEYKTYSTESNHFSKAKVNINEIYDLVEYIKLDIKSYEKAFSESKEADKDKH